MPDITQAIQDITSVKPRQKILAKKVLKKKELTPKDVTDSGQEERNGGGAGEALDEETKGFSSEGMQEDMVKRTEQRPVLTGVSPQDVPDGAQISKAFDTLCNIVRDRMRKHKKPEPIADFYTKGRYVLVTGDGSYPDPCFYTSTPSAGHIFVTIRNGMMPPYEPYGPSKPTPLPPQPMPDPRPLSPTLPSNGEGKDDDKGGKGKDNGGKGKNKKGEPQPHSKDPSPSPSGPKDPTPAADDPAGPKNNKDDNGPSGPTPKPAPRGASTSSSSSSSTGTSSYTPDAMSYEKVEVVESVEKFSNDRKVKGYEETSMVVETMIEKSSKKKHWNHVTWHEESVNSTAVPHGPGPQEDNTDVGTT